MGRCIALIQGHSDPQRKRLGHSLVDAYADATEAAGHEVRHIDVTAHDSSVLQSKDDCAAEAAPDCIRRCQDIIAWAEHRVIFYPMWPGSTPALFEGFLEQLLRPGFAFRVDGRSGHRKLLAGKSARIIVTMGLPALFNRWYLGAQGVRNLKRNMLRFCGARPIASSLIGCVETAGNSRRKTRFARMRKLDRAAR